jgi:ELWxxDGT repeat protein
VGTSRLFFAAENDPRIGKELYVLDTGASLGSGTISSIDNPLSGTITITTVAPHAPANGDIIEITGVTGVAINARWAVTEVTLTSFKLKNSQGTGGTATGGTWSQVNVAKLVKDIVPGTDSFSPTNLVGIHGKLYFAVDDGVTGEELWSSDGTPSGTGRVANIRPDSPNPAGSSPSTFVAVGDLVFFMADDGSVGGKSCSRRTGPKRALSASIITWVWNCA